MREFALAALILLCVRLAPAQPPPATWKIVQDAKGACQISVPPEWTSLGDTSGAASLKDASTALAVVTSQPSQAFQPLTESLQKVLGVPKTGMFENSAKRIFYQEKTARNADDQNAYSVSVPAKAGTCSCHIVFVPAVTEEIARKIALSLSPRGQ
jgi:hypothetical protein